MLIPTVFMPICKMVQRKIITFVNHSWQEQAQKGAISCLLFIPCKGERCFRGDRDIGFISL